MNIFIVYLCYKMDAVNYSSHVKLFLFRLCWIYQQRATKAMKDIISSSYLLHIFFFISSSSSVLFYPWIFIRNYSRDEYQTFVDDSLAFVDGPNNMNFVWKFMNARARAFTFLHTNLCWSNEIHSYAYGR
jgi:hypothetical protein